MHAALKGVVNRFHKPHAARILLDNRQVGQTSTHSRLLTLQAEGVGSGPDKGRSLFHLLDHGRDHRFAVQYDAIPLACQTDDLGYMQGVGMSTI
jgi:hypothetical protein